MKKCWLRRVLWMALVLPMMGCGEAPDPRVVQVAMESAARQAEQNQQMAELQQQVAEGAKQLVEADSQARQELAELQRELRSDQAEIGRQRDALESERRADRQRPLLGLDPGHVDLRRLPESWHVCCRCCCAAGCFMPPATSMAPMRRLPSCWSKS